MNINKTNNEKIKVKIVPNATPPNGYSFFLPNYMQKRHYNLRVREYSSGIKYGTIFKKNLALVLEVIHEDSLFAA